jgi:iron complex transport system permease protein
MMEVRTKGGKSVIVFLFCISFLVIFLFSAWQGTVDISLRTVLWSFLGKSGENLANTLIWQVRIPRFFMAFLAGACLSVSGQCMQILLRNPLADPYTMGIANGAGLGVNLALLGWLPGFFHQIYFIPLWGFAGAFGAAALVLALSGGKNRKSNVEILLIGIAVSILLNSLNTLLTYWAARQTEVRHILFWAFGNLDKSDWAGFWVAASFSLPGFLFLGLRKSQWNLLLLGEEKVSSMGFNTRRLKNSLLIISALLTAAVVCFVGPIGFVGLVVPFWTRKLIPITQNGFWRLTFFSGGLFIALCDLLSRLLFQPFGLPIGLISSLVGVPFFLYLLRDSSRKTSF